MSAAEDGRRSGGRLVDAHEAGELLCVPHTWLLREARHERIPHVRLGRYVRFEPDVLLDWCRTARSYGPQPRVGGRRV
jgi:hypothetical protein